jgi:preprotein translocase subunit Sec61beta
MSDNKIRLPSSGGGLVNYGDSYKSKLMFPPYMVVVFIVFIVIVEILLHKFL